MTKRNAPSPLATPSSPSLMPFSPCSSVTTTLKKKKRGGGSNKRKIYISFCLIFLLLYMKYMIIIYYTIYTIIHTTHNANYTIYTYLLVLLSRCRLDQDNTLPWHCLFRSNVQSKTAHRSQIHSHPHLK